MKIENENNKSLRELFLQPPEVLIIELTNNCNLRCPFCTTNLSMHRKKGYMSLSLFKILLNELSEHDCKPLLSFNMCGEPLLHNEVSSFINEASKNGFKTYISTNVSKLTNELSKKLIEAGLSSISFCIDGFTKESHESYRVGSSFQEIKINCENFLRIRIKLNKTEPHASIQTLLTSFSENELEQILEWAWSIDADEVYFKTLSIGSFSKIDKKNEYKLLPKNKLLHRTYTDNTNLCHFPIKQSIMYWNGDLGICCVDFNNMAKLANIQNSTYFDQLFSESAIDERLKGYQKKQSVCKKCHSSDASFRGIRIPLKELKEKKYNFNSHSKWTKLIQAKILEELCSDTIKNR